MIALKKEKKKMKPVLVLRTCNENLKSYGAFQWPESGPVQAPDWNPKPECGNGLHGLLWGEGNGGLLDWDPSAKWLVCEVDPNEIIELDGKVKFPRCTVVHCGDQNSATNYIAEHGGAGKAIVGHTATAGDHGTATAGDRGTATTGNNGTATAGYNGTATAGNNGKTTVGDFGTATAGDDGIATAGYNGTATAGDDGIATAGYNGTATAGHHGTATAGYNSTVIAGNYGRATAGDCGIATTGYRGTATAGGEGTATAGEKGIISIAWYDKNNRKRLLTGYIGEDGLEPNVPYRTEHDGKTAKFVKA